MKHTRVVIRWLVRLVLSAFLVLVMGALTVLVVIPRATHGVALDVLTGSMTPKIPVGSIVMDRPVDPGTLRVGDVATYQVKPGVPEYITHRIVKIDTSTNPVTFTFKGDANRGPDIKPVPATAIRGKVWFHVPYLGSIRDGLKGAFGRVLLLAVAMVILGGYAIKQFYDVIRDRHRKRNGAAADGLESLRMQFPLHAFGDVDPTFLADLLQGECQVAGDRTFQLSFRGTPERIAVIRELLALHGTVLAAAEGEPRAGTSADTPDEQSANAPDEQSLATVHELLRPNRRAHA